MPGWDEARQGFGRSAAEIEPGPAGKRPTLAGCNLTGKASPEPIRIGPTPSEFALVRLKPCRNLAEVTGRQALEPLNLTV